MDRMQEARAVEDGAGQLNGIESDKPTGSHIVSLDTTRDPRDIAQRLVEQGYHPVPIAPGTKACHVLGWPRWCATPPPRQDIDAWSDDQFAGVGLACGFATVAIDIDIVDDPDEAERIERVAREHLGDTPLVRIGKAPKRALLYRCAGRIEPAKREGLDVIGFGQMLVAFAQHPDTGKPYTWPNKSPLQVPVKDLPAVTQEQVEQFLQATGLPALQIDGGGQLQPIVRDPHTGLVTDGREAHLTMCIFRAAQATPTASPDQWANDAWREFTCSTDLVTRFNSKLSPQEALKKARYTAKRVQQGKLNLSSRHKKPKDGFVRANGKIVANSQYNIRLALERLGVSLSHDTFADRLLVRQGDTAPTVLDDPMLNRLWLEIDATFDFRPSFDFFCRVVDDQARRNAFHPVRDYLDGLTWDGVPRLDRWLVEYGGAEDCEYTRAVAALVLIAAVRRVRRPGVKFDEMLVLESPQGTNKSSALEALCPDPNWFSDDLPLNVGSKEVIEKTSGKWILEAAELSGMKKTDVEHIKAFLSRQKDKARLAYGRLPLERPRHFIAVGTTNSDQYLKDATGNRRFWPVKVRNFDLERLVADRDQLWAEAAQREAQGAPIRLEPRLWPHAAVEQDQRRIEDPWESVVAEVLGDIKGKLPTTEVWPIVGKEDVSKRTSADMQRLGEVMKRLGFTRRQLRQDGQRTYFYVRGEGPEANQLIVLVKEEDGGGLRAYHKDKAPQTDIPF